MSAADRLDEIEARNDLAVNALPDGSGPALYALDQVILSDVPILVAAIRAARAALAEAYERIGGCCGGTDDYMCDRCRLYGAVESALTATLDGAA